MVRFRHQGYQMKALLKVDEEFQISDTSWHYYKVEIRFLSLEFHHFFIWNQNFWLFGTTIRLKFDFWAWIWTISSSEIKIFGFLALLQGWNSIFEPGSHHFFIWNQNFWLFDTTIRLKFDFWAWISPLFHLKSKVFGFLTLL